MPFKNVVNEILNITIATKRDTLRRNTDPLSNNKNQYLKKHRYKKASVKQLT